MKNFNIFEVHRKMQFLQGGSQKNNIQEGLSKKGAWAFSRFRDGLSRKEGVVFLMGEVDTLNAYYGFA